VKTFPKLSCINSLEIFVPWEVEIFWLVGLRNFENNKNKIYHKQQCIHHQELARILSNLLEVFSNKKE
jgi:hypothetical protein